MTGTPTDATAPAGRVVQGTPSAGHLGPTVVRPRWMSVRTLQRVVLVAPIAVVAALAYRYRWTSDGGFVYFRVVDQIRAGNGPVFNAGERVEAVISPLWLAIVTVGDLVSPLRIEYTAALLSAGVLLAGLALATAGSAIVLGGDRTRLLAPVGLLAVAAWWPVWVWATSGLEIALAIGWIGACWYRLARWTASGRPVGSAGLALLGLGWLIRPELLVSSALFVGLVVVVSVRGPWRRAGAVAVAFAVPLLYQLFRMGYYGLIVPSVSIAREDSAPRPAFGWDYFVDTISPYLLVVPLLAVFVGVYVPFGATRRRDDPERVRRLAATVVMAGSGLAGIVIVIVVSGGDGVHARLLVPGVVAFLTPAFTVPIREGWRTGIAVVAVWAACCAPLLRPPADDATTRLFTNGYPGAGFTYDDAGIDARGRQPWIDGPGLYLANPFTMDGEPTGIELADPDRVVVAGEEVGLLGYVVGTDIDVLDLYGTADPLTGHEALGARLVPGREKSAGVPWLIARFADDPESVVPDALDLTLPYEPEVPALDALEQVQWAQAALGCGPFERLQDAVNEPLSVGRFGRNLWNAMSNTSFRFQPSPREAYRFSGCGREVPDRVLDFYDRVDVSQTLPSEPAAGDVVVTSRCDAAFAANHGEWTPIQAATFRATVTFDPDPRASLAAVFLIGPFGHDTGVVWVQTDGDGSYRVTQDVNWFPPVQQDWTTIDEDNLAIEVAIVPDLDRGEWQTTVNGGVLGRLPMLGESTEGDGALLAATPRRAAPGAESPAIVHEPVPVSRVCQAIVTAHATPNPSSRGATGSPTGIPA